MLTKAEAMRRARRLPGPRVEGVLTIRPVEVALAWMELHGYEPAKTARGNPMWVGDLLAVRKTPPPTPPQVYDLERGELIGGCDG